MRCIAGLIVFGSLLAACAEEPSTATTTQGISTTNKIAINKIAINKIAINKIAINKIAINKIAINKIAINSLAAGELLNDPDSRVVLEYLVSCAFPSGVTLVATDDAGTTYNFAGGIGLAPQWEKRRLTFKERRWISACMLARVNNSSTPLYISLRGNHPALQVSAEEAAEYTREEGSFYGDIFAREGEEQVFLTCRGADLAASPGDIAFSLRQCAQPGANGLSVCGMQWVGDCADFGAAWACEEWGDDHYGRCHTTATTTGRWCQRIQERYEEVITVYLPEQPIFGW